MNQLKDVRAALEEAANSHELVKPIKQAADAAGLLERDYLAVLCWNLLEKYDEHMQILSVPREPAPLPSKRKVVQVLNYPSTANPNQKFVVLCDDGTMWMHGGDMGWGCINDATIS